MVILQVNYEDIPKVQVPTTFKTRTTGPKLILDLRDVRHKHIQLFDAAEVRNYLLIETLLRDQGVNGVGINQMTALHIALV